MEPSLPSAQRIISLPPLFHVKQGVCCDEKEAEGCLIERHRVRGMMQKKARFTTRLKVLLVI